ncbi:MAG: endolytic transglycosylase MltG [Chloroflexota bacterium]|nr:endolytic transglycosylase MltG [Chloroflexota bacterium]
MLVRVLTQSLKIISIVGLTLLVVVGSVSFFDYWTDRERAEEIGRPVTITIAEDDDGSTLADKLTDAELINSGFYFETRFRFSADDLQPGTYTLRHGMSVSEIIDAVSVPAADDPDATVEAPGQAITVTFIEGERIEQHAQKLVEAGWEGDPQAFIDAAYNPANPDQWDFLSDLPDGGSLEGFLFPDTYDIPSNDSAQNVIDRMLTNFDARFDDSMRQAASDQGRSVFEVVTIASIVEREAAAEEERVTIAGLYLNRLDQGMALQADPTAQYVVGTEADWWPLLDGDLLDQAFDSPYNTYNEDLTPGLPVGPIANPGLRALQAVLQPEEHDYLYMQAKDDGTDTHAFATTLEEHEVNICTYDPDAEFCTGGSTGNDRASMPVVDIADRRWTNAA